MKKDFKKYLEQDDHYFSEGHLYAYFNEQYRGNTVDEVTAKLTNEHDTSLEIEVCEDELGRKLTDKEVGKLEERFNKAVLNCFITKNDVVVAFVDSTLEIKTEGYK